MTSTNEPAEATYRLVVHDDAEMTSCPWPFASIEAALIAEPALNRSRIGRGKYPYNALGQFKGDQLVAVVPLASAA